MRPCERPPLPGIKPTMTLLSVNLNKIAVLRNSRGGDEPDICQAAQTCIESGCGGITVHPRPDQRHVRPGDVRALAAMLRGRVEYNIERSEEHTSELQSLMRISYAVFCLKKKKKKYRKYNTTNIRHNN